MYYIIIFVSLKQVVNFNWAFPKGCDVIASKYMVYVKRHFFFTKTRCLRKVLCLDRVSGFAQRGIIHSS